MISSQRPASPLSSPGPAIDRVIAAQPEDVSFPWCRSAEAEWTMNKTLCGHLRGVGFFTRAGIGLARANAHASQKFESA